MTYLEKRKKYTLQKIILIIILILFSIVSINIGIAKISFADTVRILLSKIPGVNEFIQADDIAKSSRIIILNIRAPRIIMSIFVGMALSLSGGVYQGMFKNPMADPYILGISSGAAFAASIAIVINSVNTTIGISFVSVCAFVGAIVTTVFVYSISRTGGRLPATTLLLTGVAFHFLLSAGISIIMVFNRAMADRIVLWNMGSFSNSTWNNVLIVIPVVILCSLIIFLNAKNLNLLSVDEVTAKTLGVNVEKNKIIMLIVTALLVAVCVAACGIVGFVGLVIPHITRLIYKPDHRVLLPFSAIFGALFLIMCDTLARNVLPWVNGSSSEIPVGAITSAFGAPFFIYLIIKKKKIR